MFSKWNLSLTAVVALAFLSLHAAPGLAGIIDDFEDGDIWDGDPVEWSWPLVEGWTMEADVEDGNLILSGSAPHDAGILYLPEFEGWQNLRIKCSMHGPGRIGVLNNANEIQGGYYGTIQTTQDGATIQDGDLVITNCETTDSGSCHPLATLPRVADPLAIHQLEFLRDGDAIELRSWEVGVEPPEIHTVRALDNSYDDGFPGIIFIALAAGSRGIFYDFEICMETCEGSPDTEPLEFLRGDCNDDGATDIADPVYVLNHLFGGGPAPSCLQTADANDDNAVDIADPVYQLNHLFGGGSPISAPVGECGVDPTPAENAEDRLSCEAYPPCE